MPTTLVELTTGQVFVFNKNLAETSLPGNIPNWMTATDYAIGEEVIESNLLYTCTVAHTSGVFATDLGAGKWALVGSAVPSLSTVLAQGNTTGGNNIDLSDFDLFEGATSGISMDFGDSSWPYVWWSMSNSGIDNLYVDQDGWYQNHLNFMQASLLNGSGVLFTGKHSSTYPIVGVNQAGAILMQIKSSFARLQASTENAVALGGRYLDMKTAYAAYVNKLIISNPTSAAAYATKEIALTSEVPTLDRTVKFADRNLDFSLANTWTTANVTPDRVFDPTSTTQAEIAQVLGTLIEELIAIGVIK